MIQADCPRCGSKHLSDEIHAGKFLRCAKCGDPVQIGSKQGAQIASAEATSQPTAPSQTHRKIPLLSKHQLVFTACLLVVTTAGLTIYLHSRDKDIFDKIGGDDTYPTSPAPTVSTANEQHTPVAVDYHKTGDVVISQSAKRGDGELTLDNGTSEDSVVIMVDTRTGAIARNIYIQAGNTGTIKDVAPGVYSIRATVGTGWRNDRNEFTKDPDYFTFSHMYRFSEDEVGDVVHFSKWSLTLNEVPDGNVKKQPLTREEFWKSTQEQ